MHWKEQLSSYSRTSQQATWLSSWWLARNEASAAEGEEKEFEMTYEQLAAFLLEPASQAMPSEQLMAMVKNAKLKKSKGGGKGCKGARRLRKCYQCDADDRIAPSCPIRAARVAAGGPKTLDDPMGLLRRPTPLLH